MKWIDQYEFLELIVENRLEKLYNTVNVLTQKKFFIKEFKKPFTNSEERTTEAKRTMHMDHPNLVNIYEIGHQNHYDYIVMEAIDGKTLREIIQMQAPMRIDKAIAIAIQMCDALDYIHSYGLQHQQVWPLNIFCQSNGLAKILFHDIFDLHKELHHLDHREMVPYLAPEQLQGFHRNASSDIYTLSIVLYEMVTGHLPSTPNRDYSTFVDTQIFTPEFAGVDIPESLIQVIRQGLSSRRYKRYQKAIEMKQALFDVFYQVCGESISVSSPQISTNDDEKQTNKHHNILNRLLIYFGFTVATLILCATAYLVYGGELQKDAPKTDAIIVERQIHSFDYRPPVVADVKNQPKKSSVKNKWVKEKKDTEKADTLVQPTRITN